VLRIVNKLDDIEAVVGATHEMSLRATAHPFHVLNRDYRQAAAECW